MSDIIWVEKYRPRTLFDVVGQEQIVSRLKTFVENKTLPHLIFSGPAGVGKTTCAHALVRDLFGKNYSMDLVRELNASDERGIDIIRTTIKEFARQKSIIGIPFKIMILDESDNMTSAAQQALRRTMESYSKNTRFILLCNYSSKIIEPIQSRCAVFRFSPLKDEDIKKRLEYIATQEKIKLNESAMNAILYVSGGDMRKAVNVLQAAVATSDEIDEDAIFRVTGKARPEEIQKMIQLALDGKFLQSREMLKDLLLTYGLSGIDIVKQIHRELYSLDIDEIHKVKLADKTGEINFRLIEGADENIQLSSLLAQFASFKFEK
ncbi:MAG: replication factor C small subunit [Candidatus Helarchaeota archaeon]